MNIEFDECYGPLINGIFENDNNRVFAAIDPSTGKHLADICYGNENDVDRAVNAAAQAFPAWVALGQQARSRLLYQLADAL
ncbi:acyl-CoA reductase-like NAD-dependent aldehyde dehydrogenase [Pseudomonas fluorescens]|nr:acyl-CoA reductase-like NAD-dependent aldehyde dehydrogenase [Pseudomonas fluorescens]